MIPARFAPALFALIVSGLMSCIVTGIATVKMMGLGEQTGVTWMDSWSFSWPIAFVVILVVAPMTRKLVAKLTQ